MAYSHTVAMETSDSQGTFAKTQLIVFYIILLLAVDSINPVKVFLHVFPQVQPWHIASISILLMLYIFVSELKQLLYFSVKVFFHSILSIFFREVEIVGRQNIPLNGPVIFTSNHANQFIDSVVVLCTCQRTISYLMAEKSWNRRIVGDIAWAMGAVPVKRSQDETKEGKGLISLHEISQLLNRSHADTSGSSSSLIIGETQQRDPDPTPQQDEKETTVPHSTSAAPPMQDIVSTSKRFQVDGVETQFMKQMKVGDKIRIHGSAAQMKVIAIESDTCMQVETIEAVQNYMAPSTPMSFQIMERIDQQKVYESVLAKLASGGAVCIFPEGGSHDRTDLLPLKVGVSLIAYHALEKDGLVVPVVPVGLNYFRGHRFRGRVIVEFGRPTYVDPTTLPQFKKGGAEKRRVCNEFLERIEDCMRSVIVSMPDYESLQLIHTARRLFRSKMMSSSEKQDLSRRFAEGYKQLMLMTQGNPPQEWLNLQTRITDYQRELNELGLRDYQVPGLQSEQQETDGDVVLREMRLPYRIFELVLLMSLAAIPALFLNLPVGLLARLYANYRRKKALAESRVKVKGMDVMLSEKVLLCIVLVPTLWVSYGLLLVFLTNLDGPAIALILWSLPLFSYMGIVTAEAGMVGLKDLQPFYMRIFPSARRRLLKLPAMRRQLQMDMREFVKTIGPSLGDVYSMKTMDWAAFQQNSRQELRSSLKQE